MGNEWILNIDITNRHKYFHEGGNKYRTLFEYKADLLALKQLAAQTNRERPRIRGTQYIYIKGVL